MFSSSLWQLLHFVLFFILSSSFCSPLDSINFFLSFSSVHFDDFFLSSFCSLPNSNNFFRLYFSLLEQFLPFCSLRHSENVFKLFLWIFFKTKWRQIRSETWANRMNKYCRQCQWKRKTREALKLRSFFPSKMKPYIDILHDPLWHIQEFQSFVGGLVSFLRYLYLFSYSGVQHILCCVFALFVFVLCLVYRMLPVSLDCQFFHCPFGIL